MAGELQHPKRVTVVMVDGYRIFNDALSLAFSKTEDIDVFAMVGNCYAAYPVLARIPVDIALIGADIPVNDTLWLAREGKARFSHTRLLVMLANTDPSSIEAMMDAGVTGFLLKTQPLTDMFQAIRLTARGQAMMPAKLLARRTPRPASQQPSDPTLAQSDHAGKMRVTRRELDILAHLSLGLSAIDIANICNITPMTVRTHIRNLMDKLNVHTRLEAVSYALSHGLIPAPVNSSLSRNYSDNT